MPAARPARVLPRGRHKLPREVVARSQRERILLALAETMADRGYGATSVADIVAASGVSRATFYEQFTSKEDCFMTAFEQAAAIVLGPAIGDRASGASRRERFERGLRGYLDAMADAPAMGRLFMIEIYAVGPEGAKRLNTVLTQYMRAIAGELGATDERSRFAVRAVVAATANLATMALSSDRPDAVRELAGPVMELADQLGLFALA